MKENRRKPKNSEKNHRRLQLQTQMKKNIHIKNLINIYKMIKSNNLNDNPVAETISLRRLSKATKTLGTILQKVCFTHFAIITS